MKVPKPERRRIKVAEMYEHRLMWKSYRNGFWAEWFRPTLLALLDRCPPRSMARDAFNEWRELRRREWTETRA